MALILKFPLYWYLYLTLGPFLTQLFNVSVCLRSVSDRGKISRQPQVKVIHVEHTTTVFPVVPSHKGFSSSVETGTETGTGMGQTGTVGDAPVKNH